MKHQMTMFIADREVNNFMSAFDMRLDCKWFIKKVEVNFQTPTPIDEPYFLSLIEKSKDEKKFWVPAIQYMGNFFHDPSVKILSDGKHEMFISRKTES